MIPIRDTQASRNRPVVNYGIIILNILVYLFQLAQGVVAIEECFHILIFHFHTIASQVIGVLCHHIRDIVSCW